MTAVEMVIGREGERLVLDVEADRVTLSLVDHDGRPTLGAALTPDAGDQVARFSDRLAQVAGLSPRGEALDVALRWALDRALAGGDVAILAAARTEIGVPLEAFWLSDRGRR